MYQWRVTKYDPRSRHRQGHFLGEDWTSASDIGKSFGGAVLTLGAYLAVEGAYVEAAMHFLRESGIQTVTVVGLEGSINLDDDPAEGIDLSSGIDLYDGQRLAGIEIEQAIRLNLRELIWCKLESPDRFFIHIGYDYYMYIGSVEPCPGAIEHVTQIGLFVEPHLSPYS
jgi:hypothetical protein